MKRVLVLLFCLGVTLGVKPLEAQLTGGGGGSLPSSSCGDASHALGWTGNSYNCQAITGSAAAGGTPGSVQYNNAGAIGGVSITGLVKGNGASAPTAAASGTDYAPATSGTAILKGNGTGGFSPAVSGTDYPPPPSVSCGQDSSHACGYSTATSTWSNQPITGTATPGGSAGSIQYNNAGTLGGAVITGLVKGNGSSSPSAATAGTDYAPATSGSAILKGNGAGGFVNAASGADYAPATSGTSILKGNGSGAFANAVSGTDYPAVPAANCGQDATHACGYNTTTNTWSNQAITATVTAGGTTGAVQYNNAGALGGAVITGLVKGNGAGAPSAAAAGTDYAPATSGSAILKANGSGGFVAAAAGTDYAPATSGSALLKGNGSGGFNNAVAGTDYQAALTAAAPASPTIGGTGVSNPTAHTVLIAEGSTAMTPLALALDTVLMGAGAAADPTAAGVTNCGDATHALSYSTTTHAFGCQAITATAAPGGTTGSIQYNNAGALGGASITGLVKGNGASSPSAAVAGTDYAPSTGVSTSILKGNGSGAFANAVSGADYQPPIAGNTLGTNLFANSISAAGTLSGVQPACSNLTGAAAHCGTNASELNSGTVPAAQGGAGAVTGILKANGTGTVSAAVSGTDYAPGTGVSTSILKGNGTGGFSNAVSGTDYAPSTGVSTSILKGSGTGTFANAAAGTDYQAPIAGNTLAAGNFANSISTAGALTGRRPASTDLSDLPIPVSSGGTGGVTANATTAHNIGAAALGTNSDITSLTGLTTPLTVSQGGTGDTTLGVGLPLLGNGTSPVGVGSISGTTTKLASTNGTLVGGDCAKWDANGNIVDASAPCGTGGGGGTPGGTTGNIQINSSGSFGAYPGTGAAPANNWMTALNASGVATFARPASTNLSDLPIPVSSGGSGCSASTYATLPGSPVLGTTCTISDASTCVAGTPVTAGGGTQPCNLVFMPGNGWMPAGVNATGTGGGSVLSAAIGSMPYYSGNTSVSGTPQVIMAYPYIANHPGFPDALHAAFNQCPKLGWSSGMSIGNGTTQITDPNGNLEIGVCTAGPCTAGGTVPLWPAAGTFGNTPITDGSGKWQAAGYGVVSSAPCMVMATAGTYTVPNDLYIGLGGSNSFESLVMYPGAQIKISNTGGAGHAGIVVGNKGSIVGWNSQGSGGVSSNGSTTNVDALVESWCGFSNSAFSFTNTGCPNMDVENISITASTGTIGKALLWVAGVEGQGKFADLYMGPVEDGLTAILVDDTNQQWNGLLFSNIWIGANQQVNKTGIGYDIECGPVTTGGSQSLQIIGGAIVDFWGSTTQNLTTPTYLKVHGSDASHPCQGISDIGTYFETTGCANSSTTACGPSGVPNTGGRLMQLDNVHGFTANGLVFSGGKAPGGDAVEISGTGTVHIEGKCEGNACGAGIKLVDNVASGYTLIPGAATPFNYTWSSTGTGAPIVDIGTGGTGTQNPFGPGFGSNYNSAASDPLPTCSATYARNFACVTDASNSGGCNSGATYTPTAGAGTTKCMVECNSAGSAWNATGIACF